ncbi:MAG: hypothetical protein ED859_11685 [Desulfuromonadales bacterium]|nr:MAG: hypothetical protein ED859_11685 [Desulfuromonadales bacterium]
MGTLVKGVGPVLMVLVFLTAISAAGPAILAAAAGEPSSQGVRVRVLLSPGRPEQSFEVSAQTELDRLREILTASSPVSRSHGTTVIPSNQSYRGVVVENRRQIKGIPAWLAVFRGEIETRDKQPRFFSDTDNSLEKFLIELGMQKGVLDRKIFDRIKENNR